MFVNDFTQENFRWIIRKLNYQDLSNEKGVHYIFDHNKIQRWKYVDKEQQERLFYLLKGIEIGRRMYHGTFIDVNMDE